MIKPKGLGRGLDALLGGGAEKSGIGPQEGELRELALTKITPGKYQPRTHMDQAALETLADSIRQRGIVQPILVRQVGTGANASFEIVAGERRWRAAKLAGLANIPALVREINDDAAMRIGLIENIQREDLNPMEEAAGIKRLVDEFKLTHDEAAHAVGRSRSAVSNLLRLLELAKPVRDMVMEGKLDMGHARALLSLGKSQQVELAHQIVLKQLSVRDAERLVQAANKPAKVAKALETPDRDLKRLENELAEKLGTAVKLKSDKKGRGTLTIQFHSLEQFDGILARTRLK